VDTNQIIINTEAHSLHTDRNVGQRVVLQGGMQTGSQTIGNYDLTALDFGGQPQGGVVRMSHTSNFNPLGGTYLAETRNFLSPIDDTDWGGIPSSGMALWLKADSLDLADGDAISLWKDVSGNGHEFTQATASSQPSYTASDSDFNNMPLVACDGSDEMTAPFSELLNTNQMTLFIVAAITTDNDNYNGIVVSRRTSPNVQGFNLYGNMTGSSNSWQFWYGRGANFGAINAGTDTVAVNQPAILTAQIAGGDGAGATATQTMRHFTRQQQVITV
jgi:hypothetical protein